MLDLQFDDLDPPLMSEGSADLLVTAPVRQLAQGVVCGAFHLAFSFAWARQIVDQFELVSIPRSPTWVLGAVNAGGLIVPVVDLDNYFSQSDVPAQLQRGQRLLVGGVQAEDADGAMAVIFSQTPAQLEYESRPLDASRVLPPRLQEVCSSIAMDDSGREFLEIDLARLADALSAELSVI